MIERFQIRRFLTIQLGIGLWLLLLSCPPVAYTLRALAREMGSKVTLRKPVYDRKTYTLQIVIYDQDIDS